MLSNTSCKDSIISLFEALLKDKSLDVRVNIFKTFHELTSVASDHQLISTKELTDMVRPVFIKSGKDSSWKNRIKILESLLTFQKELGTEFINDSQILNYLLGSWSDQVFAVRQATLEVIRKLSERLGTKWCERNILPAINAYMSNTNYLLRENALFGIKSLVDLLSPEVLARTGAQLLEMSTTEKVAPVMILILQTIKLISTSLSDKNFDENAKIMYNTLLNDPDSDVSYYAKKYASSK